MVFTTQPVGGVAEGVNLATQPVVEVQDAYSNTATSNTSSVTLSIATGPAAGALVCASNPLAATAGVAAFAGCKITGTAAAGTYSLTASDGALTSATSSTFTIVVGAASKVAFTTQPVGGVAEGVNLSTQPVVSVQDAYGNVVTGDTSSVTLSVASGPAAGTIGCTANPLAASSSVATFAGCQITGTAAAGTYTLTASDGSLTSATSASFTINVGAATKVAFSTQPVGGVAENVNLATQPVVSVQDAYGNVVTGNTSSVTLAIASGPATGTFACTANPLAATAGVATFATCKINGTGAAGTYTLTATDGALTSAASSSFTIVAGTATKVAFTTQPVGGVAEGVNLGTQPVVSVQDAFGNTVTGNTSSVTLSIASGPGSGSLACTANPLAASSGVASFAGCKITGTAAAGTYTLTASDGALTSATSSSFTIVVGAAAAVAFTTQPVGGVGPGVNLPTQPVVSIRDAYANVVTSDTSSVTLSIASGPGAGSLACTSNPLAATAGVATFAGCKVNGTSAAAGTYTLLASDGALTTAVSASFTILSGVLSFTTSDYGFSPVTLNGADQIATGTLVLDVSDSTGSAAGWKISVSAGAWTGGTTGVLTSAQSAYAQPATPTCDGGVGTCTPAVPSGLSWPIAFSGTPTVLYNAAASTGMSPQTVNVPVRLPIPGGLQATGTFSQTISLSLTSGP